ncbi:helix-turn-helix domain-containing protein [Dactylosporangium sp. CA-233914]|uniref:helix-turn-helix domain-containing protein n=1 Tax=Dactylosporangium sp. CA-233914 TaxID=3239934 RepID=UPI003D92F5E0
MAEAATMTQSAVARFEAGATVPTLPVLERLARALDVEHDRFGVPSLCPLSAQTKGWHHFSWTPRWVGALQPHPLSFARRPLAALVADPSCGSGEGAFVQLGLWGQRRAAEADSPSLGVLGDYLQLVGRYEGCVGEDAACWWV